MICIKMHYPNHEYATELCWWSGAPERAALTSAGGLRHWSLWCWDFDSQSFWYLSRWAFQRVESLARPLSAWWSVSRVEPLARHSLAGWLILILVSVLCSIWLCPDALYLSFVLRLYLNYSKLIFPWWILIDYFLFPSLFPFFFQIGKSMNSNPKKARKRILN